MQARPGQPKPRPGLTFGIQRLQRRPEGLGDGRLQPAPCPGVVRIYAPEAIADSRNHAGVWTGASSSLSMRCGSRSGAISGSDAGSGISMTRTGLLVNPMTLSLTLF